MRSTRFLAYPALGLAVLAAQAATVEMFSPQGEVKGVRQVAARFSAQVVPLGDPRLVEPFDVACAENGTGRWADGRNWVYDFSRHLPAGNRCSFTLKPGLKTLAGEAIDPARFTFTTGGPAIRHSLPHEGAALDEHQVFILALDAPATDISIETNAYCAVEGIGERIGVRVLRGDEKAKILANRSLLGDRFHRLLFKGPLDDPQAVVARIKDPRAAPLPAAALQCRRTLPNGATMRLVWGKDIATASGIATNQDQALAFQVRPTFTAQFRCSRVNAQAPCVPVVPMELVFSAPVARADAARIRVRAEGGPSYAPKLPDGNAPFVDHLSFGPSFPERTTLRVELPAGLKDDAGRALANASSFPLAVATDESPPLAKFPARFGIIELNAGAVLPVTLRNVEPDVAGRIAQPGAIPGQVLAAQDDQTILDWLRRVNEVRARHLRNPRGGYTAGEGEISVFEGITATRRIEVPKPGGAQAFEVVGIPLERPGFYVVELASPKLGAALHGETKPYYVQTAALVTNLAAHLKRGRESSLVWVTTLDKAQPVAGAAVAVRDCRGRALWEGKTGADGAAAIEVELPRDDALPDCRHFPGRLFVSARSGADLTFVLSAWDEGLQPWQFNVATGSSYGGPRATHTVLDRALFRAGETVGMKHFVRTRTTTGFDLPGAAEMPAKVVVEHQGSEQRYDVAVKWDSAGSGESTWTIPKDVRLGTYEVRLHSQRFREVTSASFRVEEFRVPTMKALVQGPKDPLVNPQQAQVDVLVSYLSGGGASYAPVKLRTQVQPRSLAYPDYPDFSFGGPDVQEGPTPRQSYVDIDEEDEDASAEPPSAAQPGRLTQVLPLRLDRAGAARTTIDKLPPVKSPQDLVIEMEYQDANGESLAAAARVPLWPSQINLGIRTEGWAASNTALRFQVLALDLAGKPVPNTAVRVDLFQRRYFSHRKRLVGGFYAYEDHGETKRIGEACAGRTNARGILACTAKPNVAGEVILRARAADASGNATIASRSQYVVGEERMWFRLPNNDRMDVLPEKKRYEPGDTARFQVRMPFADATALVTVEREGVIERRVMRLSGREPVVEVPLKGHHAPNVFVSVLALRGRLAPPSGAFAGLGRAAIGPDVPFGVIGWLPARNEARVSATVDLGKPAFKLGLAEINVGWAAHELKVGVTPERDTYQVRDRAVVRVAVRRADGGAPPADTEIAVAAVDEGLLELAPNASWKLLESMMQRRPEEVTTSTAQMQVVGKRHFGRKAVAPGGGGGRQAGRELFDPLLVWQPRVRLDERGEARVEIPLNDSLTAFRVVAVANGGADLFGTGDGTLRTTQDLMLVAGLPQILREGDEFQAGFTVRNASDRKLRLDVEAILLADGKALPRPAPQAVDLAPGEAREITWQTAVPMNVGQLAWDVTARQRGGGLSDRMRVTQRVIAAHPVRVHQSTLLRVDQPLDMPVAIPVDAVPGRGGVALQIRPRLAADLHGVREYMSEYPYTCMEQRTSRAVALRDEGLWKAAMNALPAHLDRDGLARHFPTDWLDGSDVLTAYVLSIADESGWEVPEAARQRMLQGLAGFVDGRILRHGRLPTADLAIRKLAAIEALARYGEAQPKMLDSIAVEPNLWPTSAVLDWLGVLQRVEKIPRRTERLAEAKQILRARLSFQGTSMGFATERSDALWWLMVSTDQNAVRAVLALADDPAWREDVPRMVVGSLGRQRRGHWNTTLANAWGVLAIEKFSARSESAAVAGTTAAALGSHAARIDWSRALDGGNVEFAWPATRQPLTVTHDGRGKPWLTVTSRAAIPLKAPLSSGYTIRRSVAPVDQKTRGEWTRGDVYRVTLDIDAQSDMTWVVVSDPIPAGAAILGSGLARDSQLLAQPEKRQGSRAFDSVPVFEERSYEAFRAYYEFVPKGPFKVEYTVRLNNGGGFDLPTTRVEAMYAPEMFGELPNARLTVKAR